MVLGGGKVERGEMYPKMGGRSKYAGSRVKARTIVRLKLACSCNREEGNDGGKEETCGWRGASRRTTGHNPCGFKMRSRTPIPRV